MPSALAPSVGLIPIPKSASPPTESPLSESLGRPTRFESSICRLPRKGVRQGPHRNLRVGGRHNRRRCRTNHHWAKMVVGYPLGSGVSFRPRSSQHTFVQVRRISAREGWSCRSNFENEGRIERRFLRVLQPSIGEQKCKLPNTWLTQEQQQIDSDIFSIDRRRTSPQILPSRTNGGSTTLTDFRECCPRIWALF